MTGWMWRSVSHAEFISASFNVTTFNKMQVKLNDSALRDPETGSGLQIKFKSPSVMLNLFQHLSMLLTLTSCRWNWTILLWEILKQIQDDLRDWCWLFSHTEFISASFNVTAFNKMQVKLNDPALRDPETSSGWHETLVLII